MAQKKLDRHHERNTTSGRYIKAYGCDACGKSTNEAERYTDDEVCGGTDGPGFFLCHREVCIVARDLPLDQRRALYERQRAINNRRAR